MKSTGIIRNIDELGRIVIPKEIRNAFDIKSSDPVEIYTEGDRVILTKYYPACIFCGGNEGVGYYKGKKVCARCLAELKSGN